MNIITCPEFTNLDREIIYDFKNCLIENVEDIEFCISKLDTNEDPDLIDELFRAMHSLKGNCRMVLLLPFVYITHELEEIVSEMRDDQRHYHHLYGSIFISVITIIEKMTIQLIEQAECSGEMLEKLDVMIKKVRNAKANATSDDLIAAEEVLSELIVLQEAPLAPSEMAVQEPVSPPPERLDNISAETAIEKPIQNRAPIVESNSNLLFFQKLSKQLDNLSIYRHGRTQEVLELCLALNEKLREVVDEKQLTAAAYIHDFGMAFVSAVILNKQQKLSKEELTIIHEHVNHGRDLLINVDGWQQAAIIVEQHHERYDGTGYPNGLKENEINPGAVMLALADTYCAITNERSDRSYKKVYLVR